MTLDKLLESKQWLSLLMSLNLHQIWLQSETRISKEFLKPIDWEEREEEHEEHSNLEGEDLSYQSMVSGVILFLPKVEDLDSGTSL